MTPRHIVAATIGNAMEFYDFMVFAFFAIQIGEAFFPNGDAYVSLMAALATFGAGFVTRPLGALVLGRFGDRVGRSPAMMLSMGLMGTAILMLVLCPDYASIGIAAPVIAVFSRLLQGFALGGEIGPSTAYMLEGAPESRRGLFVSFQRASQTGAQALGAVVGLILAFALSGQAYDEYGWRIALGLGALVAPYALYLRRRMPEPSPPPDIEHAERHLEGTIIRTIVCGFLILTGSTIGAYVGTYMATFAQRSLGLSPAIAMSAQAVSFTLASVAALWGGHVSDALGRRNVLFIGYGMELAALPAIFAWMIASPSLVSLVVGSSVIGALHGFGGTAAMIGIIELLPRRIRSLGYALVYTLPVSIFGGTTQMVATWLIEVTGSPMAVAWYCTGAIALAVVAALAIDESAPAQAQTEPALAA